MKLMIRHRTKGGWLAVQNLTYEQGGWVVVNKPTEEGYQFARWREEEIELKVEGAKMPTCMKIMNYLRENDYTLPKKNTLIAIKRFIKKSIGIF